MRKIKVNTKVVEKKIKENLDIHMLQYTLINMSCISGQYFGINSDKMYDLDFKIQHPLFYNQDSIITELVKRISKAAVLVFGENTKWMYLKNKKLTQVYYRTMEIHQAVILKDFNKKDILSLLKKDFKFIFEMFADIRILKETITMVNLKKSEITYLKTLITKLDKYFVDYLSNEITIIGVDEN